MVGYALSVPTARFYPDMTNGHGVRLFVEAELRRQPVAEETLFMAQLLATELVTNAVRHARSPVDLTVARQENRIRLEARDDSTSPPSPHPPDTDTRHRGLLILEDLSQDWGVEVKDPNGKVVWCEVDSRQTASDPGAAARPAD